MAFLLAVILPGLFLGPFIIGVVSWRLVSHEAIVFSAVSALAGIWLLAVSAVANDEDIERVIEPLTGAEAALLFLPYMVFIGTRVIWRRVRQRGIT